ncbi:glycosyltransferase family 4 protein [Hanstruepera marina]|uniref:glycosyltransferase family 4 protein n=1 Tax=Hanstruepera marina TaxID=2873265 RepID=UPI002104EC9E|nr:glycosyltransferase family 4 protein [Hanstruepera marina]
MKNLLYIGNNLNNKRSNVSSIVVLGPMLEAEGFNVRYASSYSNKVWRFMDMLKSCIKYRNWADAVIIDTYSTQNFYYALAVSQLCRLLNITYIPSLNGGNLPVRLEKNPGLCRLIFRTAYKLVSPSVYLQEAFKYHGYTNVTYIPNSLELDAYKYVVKAFNHPKLLWVRSFSKIYNPTLAVKVLKVLQEDGIQAELCMVGPDSDGSLTTVQDLAKAYNVSVNFTGKLPKTDWVALAADYNIFINTTNFDNMPVSVIEAMALGLPIVSTEVGGIPFLIDHETDGLLVPANDALAMANAIKRIINSPVASQAMAFNARKKVELFAWKVVKHQWFEVLQ